MTLEIHPATADRYPDVCTMLAPKKPDAPACWCLSYRLSGSDPMLATGGGRAETMRRLTERTIAPGILAYREGEPVGWCSVGPRGDFHRLSRSRVLPRIDALPVWSVICFVVRAGYRGQGVASEMLRGAAAFAREHGADVLEGYPADTKGHRISGAFAYTGTRLMFERVGFVKVADTASRTGGVPRVVMRLDLGA
jgi:GNAT superfamily N-acetyltransferase